MGVCEKVMVTKIRDESYWLSHQKMTCPPLMSILEEHDPIQHKFLKQCLKDGITEVVVELRRPDEKWPLYTNPQSIDGLKEALNWMLEKYLVPHGRTTHLTIYQDGSGGMLQDTDDIDDVEICKFDANLEGLEESLIFLALTKKQSKLTVYDLWTKVKDDNFNVVGADEVKENPLVSKLQAWIRTQPKVVQRAWYHLEVDDIESIEDWIVNYVGKEVLLD